MAADARRMEGPDSRERMGRTSHIGVFAVLAAVLLSCAAPVSSEMFVRNGSRDAMGRYVFEADMTDSLHAFSMDLYVAFNCPEKEFSTFSRLPVNVLWVSPEGIAYEDNIMLAGEIGSRSSSFGRTMRAAYRSGIVPSSHGIWKVMVSVPEDSVRKYGITGLGMKLKKE